MSENQIDKEIEPLEKGKCVRCGAHTSGGKGGRCPACLKKLAAAKKKPGSWQRAQTKADDASRRQKGKNGTAHKKSKGLGTRASIVKQTQSAEKKTGEKLSPDRKNNAHGYAASNTRMVPEHLNRGRHHVDPKKLKAWKAKLKKHNLDTASLYTLIKSKFHDAPEALELLKSIGPDGLSQYIELASSLEEMLKAAEMTTNPPIDKSKFKYKHAKDTPNESHYDVHHDGNLVGQIHINKKNNAPSGGQVSPAFHPLLDHIATSVKSFHIARNS